MKKTIGFLALTLIFGAVLISGCGTNNSSTTVGTVVPDGLVMAQNVGGSFYEVGTGSENLLYMLNPNAPFRAGRGVGIMGMGPMLKLATYSNGWWRTAGTTTEDDTLTVVYNLNLKAWKLDGTEITTEGDYVLANINTAEIVASMTNSSTTGSSSVTIGSNSSPFFLEGRLVSTSESGVSSVSVAEGAKNFAVAFDFDNVALDSMLFPLGGGMNFRVTSTYYVPITGIITFEAGGVETLMFTTPTTLEGTRYWINMWNSQVTTQEPG